MDGFCLQDELDLTFFKLEGALVTTPYGCEGYIYILFFKFIQNTALFLLQYLLKVLIL